MNAYKILITMIIMNLVFGFVISNFNKDTFDESNTNTYNGYGFNTTAFLNFEDESTRAVEAIPEKDNDEEVGGIAKFFAPITEFGDRTASWLGAAWEITKYIGSVVKKAFSPIGFDKTIGLTPLEKLAFLIVEIMRILVNIVGIIMIINVLIRNNG